MKRASKLTSIKAVCQALCCAVLLMFNSAGAAVVNITTEFKADIRNPGHNEFKNTTPQSGLCQKIPEKCNKDEVSILIPGLAARKPFQYASKDKKNNPWLAIDGQTREVELTNKQTGKQTTARFRWAFIGVQYSGDNVGEGMRGASTPDGDCSHGGALAVLNEYYLGWKINSKKAICFKHLHKNISDGVVKLTDFSLGYTLKTEKPLELPAGEYEGEVVYSVGDGMDVDFAADAYSDSEVRIKIKAVVEHAFYIKFPRDNMDVQLTPPGGWSSWINGGVTPQKLSSDVPFTLSSSGSFKVSMQCEHAEGRGCGLQNKASGEMVPLDVKMTIPGFVSAGQPVRSLALNAGNARIIDPPGYFAVDLTSKLDFSVSNPSVDKMVKQPGSKWEGVVTLVFDSEIQ